MKFHSEPDRPEAKVGVNGVATDLAPQTTSLHKKTERIAD